MMPSAVAIRGDAEQNVSLFHAMHKHDGVLCPANGLGHDKSTTLASLPWSACSQHIDWVGLLGIEGEDWSAICTLPHLSFKAIKATTCLNPSPRGYSLPAGIVQKPLRFEAYGDFRSYLGAPMKFSVGHGSVMIPVRIFVERFVDNVWLPMQFWQTEIASTKYRHGENVLTL